MKRSIYLFVTLAMAGQCVPVAALAHSELVSSVPSENGILASNVREITMIYNEAVKPVSCKVADSTGSDADVVGKIAAKGITLHVPLKDALPSGKYRLTCRVVGPDSHAMNESLVFVVN